jgi:monoamine oxidase
VALSLLVVVIVVSILIAGAGLAGLTAAHEVARAGAAVTIVDARDYAGGRVRTIRDFANGQHAELGGEFIERDHKDVVELCNAFGLPLVRVLDGGFTHRFRDAHGTYHVSRTAPWATLVDALAPLVRRYKRADGDLSSDAIREMSTVSLREWLHRSHASPELHSMATALRGLFLADPDELSVLPVVEQIVKGGSPAQVELFRIEGGNDRLVDALVRATPARLLLGHTVRTVVQEGDRVVLRVTDAAGGQQEIKGDCLVMTLPASTLRDVDIRPALPEHQQNAIRTLSYGRATKALVQSPVALFGTHHARAFATDACLGTFWDSSEHQGGASSIIAFLAGGSASSALRDLAARGGRDVLAELCWLRMNRAPVTKVHVGDWTADPWARGGYAFFDPGFDPAWRPLLAKRAGRIAFAGEHTSQRWQGYMTGAVESGRRAAHELLHRFS